MDIIQQIKKITQVYGIAPARSKGQNFLVNPEIIKTIVSSAGLEKGDTVLEVGPGLGILTEELVKNADRVLSVELDDKLFDFLKIKFADSDNLELVKGDILKMPDSRLPQPPYKVVANIPYNITSILIRKFLTAEKKPESMTLLVQKEVAQRLCAKPGQMSLLAVSVQLYGLPKIVAQVPKSDFWPKPEVDSAVIQISEIKSNLEISKILAEISEKDFWQLVRIGFSAKRKQLQHNLSAGFKISPDQAKNWISGVGLDSKVRAQNLSVGDWVALAKIKESYLK